MSVLFLASLAALAVPMEYTHTGRLLDGSGVPLAGNQTVRFSVHTAATGGSELWGEDASIDFDDGYYSHVLGSDTLNNPLDGGTFDGTTHYLQLSIGGVATGDRLPILSVPYAVRANTAVNVDGGTVDATSIAVDGTTVIDSSGAFVGEVAGSTLDDLTCLTDQIPVYNGTTWGCGSPASGGVVSWNDLSGIPVDFADQVDDDTLGAIGCTVDSVLSWDAAFGSWGCGQIATVDWSTLPGIPADFADGVDNDTDTQLSESDVETFVTNGPLDLASGSMMGSVDLATVDMLDWSNIASIPGGFADGVDDDTTLTEAEVETFVTNGPLDLDAGTTIGGVTAQNTVSQDVSVAAYGAVDIDHSAVPGVRVSTQVWWDDAGTWRLLPELGENPEHRFGRGIDGDLVLDGNAGPTFYIEDYVPGYDGVNRVAEVRSLTLTNGAVLTTRDWDGDGGGRIMIRSLGAVDICSGCGIDADFLGYRGGDIHPDNNRVAGVQGEGPGGGFGPGRGNSCGHGGGGGGAGYATDGGYGQPCLDRCNSPNYAGAQGRPYGDPGLQSWPMTLGSGGGSGSEGHDYVTNAREPGAGGDGGGAIGIWAPTINNAGTLSANGEQGYPHSGWGTSNPQVGSGGAGSGGSVLLWGDDVTPGTIDAVGGPLGITHGWGSANNQQNGQRGGAGGDGRIYIRHGTLGAMTANPSATTVPGVAGDFDLPSRFGWGLEIVDADTVRLTSYAATPVDLRVVITALP